MRTALLLLLVAAPSDDDVAFFEAKVRPVLVRRCEKCHGEAKQEGALRLDRRSGWERGGDSGPAIVPGKPDESRLVRAVRHVDADLKMPPDGKIPDREVEALAEWVRRGAIDPRDGGPARLGAMTVEDARRWWSFQPVTRPAVPSTRTPSPNPIDAFVAAALEAKGMSPAPPADKRTLIRRASYDLTGLPPSPRDVEAFLADDSPDAFAKVVDRLLASPHYGERWGRKWLDLVRFADTAGENSDRPLPHAWKYRNWVISAFNRDLPYDEFVRDQIAGDLLAADGPPDQAADRIVATGFLAVARRFGHDADKDMYLTYEDVIDTTTKSLLGLTVACARCHSHKYDAISNEDYYALYGVFESSKFSFPGCEPKPQPRDLVPLPGKDWAYAVVEGTPKNARLQIKGDPEKPGAEVPRRWLEALGGGTFDGPGSGRKALAERIADPKNPLTARVMANRVWQGHFGKGIVRTPNDLGTRGLRPTHPELLDWLASELVASGWHIKPLHRLIMLSDAYQRGGGPPSEADPEDLLFARFGRRRLDAEEIRDSLLIMGGKLDRTPGAAHPFPPEASWAFTQHNPFSADYPTDRRAVYRMVQRNRRDPFLALFDGADPNATTPERGETTVPTQALFVLNDPFFHEQADHLADALMATAEAPKRVDAAFRIAFQRPPTAGERSRAGRFLVEYAAAVPPETPGGRDRAAMAAFARVLLGSNEFFSLD